MSVFAKLELTRLPLALMPLSLARDSVSRTGQRTCQYYGLMLGLDDGLQPRLWERLVGWARVLPVFFSRLSAS